MIGVEREIKVVYLCSINILIRIADFIIIIYLYYFIMSPHNSRNVGMISIFYAG
jgi:hypothetical protein